MLYEKHTIGANLG